MFRNHIFPQNAAAHKVNQMPVLLNMSQGFSRIIVLDTIRGMIRHLKLADPNGAIRIEVEMEAES